MGVSGSGKSTLAQAIASQLRVRYLDADDFHPESNVAKMRAGEPLTDADRAGWLATLHGLLRDAEGAGEGGGLVLACSALRRSYRDQLRGQQPVLPLRLVLLHGPREVLEQRLRSRPGHFMPASLLDSQLATLEVPGSEENAIHVPLEMELSDAVSRVENLLNS